jgi:hypothetical protein
VVSTLLVVGALAGLVALSTLLVAGALAGLVALPTVLTVGAVADGEAFWTADCGEAVGFAVV